MRAVLNHVALGLAVALATGSAGAAPGPEISVSFAAAQSDVPLDGRIILLLSRDLSREPRSHVEPDEPLASPFIFGQNVERPGAGSNGACR